MVTTMLSKWLQLKTARLKPSLCFTVKLRESSVDPYSIYLHNLLFLKVNV